jgi:RNA polymerase sigma-70 factor (ECF subfamily)
VKGGGDLEESLNQDNFILSAVEKYSGMLVRLCFSYMKNMSDAEDLTQDIFLKLLHKKPSFENSEHEKAWLIRVAINLSKNRLKTAWFRKTVPLDENACNFTSKENEILSTVLELPVKYRSMIHLFYYEEYSIAEISQILGINESTVGSQLHRARKLLKSKLKGDFDGE